MVTRVGVRANHPWINRCKPPPKHGSTLTLGLRALGYVPEFREVRAPDKFAPVPYEWQPELVVLPHLVPRNSSPVRTSPRVGFSGRASGWTKIKPCRLHFFRPVLGMVILGVQGPRSRAHVLGWLAGPIVGAVNIDPMCIGMPYRLEVKESPVL